MIVSSEGWTLRVCFSLKNPINLCATHMVVCFMMFASSKDTKESEGLVCYLVTQQVSYEHRSRAIQVTMKRKHWGSGKIV